MLGNMKLVSLKRMFRFTRIYLVIGIALLYFFSEKAIRQWQGPSDILTLSEGEMENQFVEIKIKDAYPLLYRDTLYNGEFAQYYLLAVDGIDSYITLDVPIEDMQRVAYQLKDVLHQQGATSIGTEVVLRGVIKTAPEPQRKSYIKYASEQKLDTVLEGKSIDFFLIQTEEPYGSTAGYILWTKLGIIIVSVIVLSYILGIFGCYQVLVRIKLKKTGVKAKQIEEDYKNATVFTGDIRIGKNYTFLHIGPLSMILENQEIFSVYTQNVKFEFRKAVHRQELYFQTVDQSKYKTVVNTPGKILTYYKEQFPKIQVDEWDDKRFSSYS